MAGQRGRDLLIRISDGGAPENFITLAGIRTSEIELSADSIDGTAADSPDGWRELLAGAGVKRARVGGRGVFKDAASDALMRQTFFSGELARLQLLVPGMGTFTGSMHIRELKWGGAYDGEASFAVVLESAGAMQFEAVT